MGIQGLLPLLKSIMVPIHIKDLEGCSVAVDTYSWLHKGALSCSKELCKGLPTSRHIDYCMHRVNLLRHNGVKPVLVFDGGPLPMKGEQENKRARSRKENLARAIEHESNGNMAAAYECYQKAVDITPLIAHELIQVLKKENVSYVVAPYEADAQMTFLAVSKQVDAVITEDSDLIPFGCPRIIFKMDKFGQAVQFQYSMLQQNKELNFSGFTKQMLLEMCIFSGCDYLPSLPGMGLKRAHALVKRFTTYEKVIKHLRYSISSVPPQYEESFKKAILTFRHQRVYDPLTEEIVHMSGIPSDALENLDFVGPDIPRDIAKGIAECDLDPFTGLPFEVENTSVSDTFKLKNVNHGTVKKKLDLPVQKNLLTNYFCFASIEAKRNFRAPRSSPKQQIQGGESSLGPAENVKCVAPKTSFTENFEDGKDTDDHERGEEHIFLQQPKHPIHRPCLMQRKDHKLDSEPDQLDDKVRLEENKVVSSSYFQQKKANKSDHKNACEDSVPENIPDSIEGKIRKENRKVVVRSSYFQHKPVNESDHENSLNILSKENLITGTYEESVCDDFSALKRRKTTSESNIVQAEYVTSKQRCTEIDEGKFGAKISHLAQYSNIAGKSMEKFVSVISSFKFSSSGSRASGLRAPLKEIRNTSTNKSTTHADFNRFAFAAPKKS